ncbi:1,4-alpha-glucan branching protein [Streptomyces sp. NPDC051940]|uniref:maltokinase N-terminal cap-like domain-containing protein n=1 Tax=Streptomyces sp. NPDC051940 TaxID=3155675 RepID=UPI0034200515
MARIHNTTVTPTKLELLAAWLPRQPWHEGDGSGLRRAGGFRLEDPEGEVGIEFMVVGSGDGHYLVPMSYRGAPLDGADDALIGTSEHGVLGKRWVYDAVRDPVAVAQLVAFMRGEAPAHSQHLDGELDPSVHGKLAAGAPVADFRAVDGPTGTEVTVEPGGPTLRVHRRIAPGTVDEDAVGHVTAVVVRGEGEPGRGVYVTARA